MKSEDAGGKIKLSEILDSQAAIKRLAAIFVKLHQEKNGGRPTQHAAIVGHDTDTAWNTLLFYLDGGSVNWVQNGPVEHELRFDFPLELLTELQEMIEIDVSEEKLQALSNVHPFRLLNAALRVAAKQGVPGEDKNYKKEVLSVFTPFLSDLLNNVQLLDRGMQIFPDAQLKSKDLKGVTIQTKDKQTITLGVNQLIQKTEKGLTAEMLDHPIIIQDQLYVKQMHENMMKAEGYHQMLEKSVRDFVNHPNPQADLLAQRVMQRRPQPAAGQRRPKVSVVGMGPAGVFAAIRAYQKGAQITAIDKETSYSRSNVFRLTPDIVDQLIKLFVDKPEDIATLPPTHPLRRVIDMKVLTEQRTSKMGPFHAISIKDFEYLANAWVDLMAKKDPEGMKVFRGYAYIPKCIDSPEKEIYIRKGENVSIRAMDSKILPTDTKVPTDILVAADGYYSRCRADSHIPMIEMSTGAPYATLTYHTPRGGADVLFKSLVTNKPPGSKPDLAKMKLLGWHKDTPPVARYFNTGDHPYIGTEIPPKLADEYQRLSKEIENAEKSKFHSVALGLKNQRNDLITQWCNVVMEMFVPEAEIKNMVLKQSSLFETKLQKSDKASCVLDNGMAVTLVGDSMQSAHFQTGRGAIVGIEEANDLSLCIEATMNGAPLEKSLKEYETRAQRRALSIEELAFHFPSGEDLQVKPTADFRGFREDTRVGILQENPVALKAETSREAQAKADAAKEMRSRKR